MEAEFYLSIDFKIDGNEDDDFEIGQLLRINSNNEGNFGSISGWTFGDLYFQPLAMGQITQQLQFPVKDRLFILHAMATTTKVANCPFAISMFGII